jgi:hypothetical protein
MAPTTEAIERITERLRLGTPILAVYDTEADERFTPFTEARGATCCFAFYNHWLNGETVIFRKGGGGCGGAQVALGLKKDYPPYMAHFLTDGKGAPMGEGLKAAPEIAQEFLDNARPPDVASETVLIGPLRIEPWDAVRSVTFLVDPDRLSALMTLSSYWSADTRLVSAPFSSGCGMLWRELTYGGEDRPVIGGTDIAARRYLPPDIMVFSVTSSRFEQMLTIPDGSFLDKEWWNNLMKHRRRAEKRGSAG